MCCIYSAVIEPNLLTQALYYAMLNWLPTALLAKQVAKFVATRFNALSRQSIVPSDHSTILEFDPVAPVNIDYLPAEYCLDRGFHFLIPSRDDWGPNTVAHPEHLDIYTDCSKLDNGVGRGISSGKLDISISLRLPDYCSVVQADVMVIY